MKASEVNGTPRREQVKLLVFSASLRGESLNSKLAQLVARRLSTNMIVDYALMREFDCPSYDGELEARGEFPAGAQEFQRRLQSNDAFVVVSPEYNASMPGLLKNAIDWVSRCRPQPFSERHCLLLSVSPSMMGGNRGLWSLRVPFEHLGAQVYPDMFSLAQGHNAFSAAGDLANQQLQDRLDQTLNKFVDSVEATKHYPCLKTAWVEFLGERPDPIIDRVE